MGRIAENQVDMRPTLDDNADLERALLRRGVVQRSAHLERCGRCQRTPLVGERVYLYEHGVVCCELCRASERRAPTGSHLIHGFELGHSIRITDQRAA
jgi:hypothetical protein